MKIRNAYVDCVPVVGEIIPCDGDVAKRIQGIEGICEREMN